MIWKLSWIMGNKGVVTIYCRATDDTHTCALADIYRQPLKLRYGLTEEQARAAQIGMADRLCALWNDLQSKRPPWTQSKLDQYVPTPPADPDIRKTTKAMVDAAFMALPADADGTIGSGEMYRVLDAALAAAPAPIQPAPQPNADEREALVRVVEATGPIYSTVDAETIADALLAAGWTRKREEG